MRVEDIIGLMNAPSLPPPHWVDTPHALARMIADLSRWPQIAVDTESNGLHAYQERICLLQISTPQADYLIDPLAIADLQPLGTILADPSIEKVFHAATNDLWQLSRDFGFRVRNLFDTQHAARVLGYPMLGLDALLEKIFRVHLDKRHQKANWAERPLSPERLEYARLDSHYLIELRQVLAEELRLRGRWELAQEDFWRLCEEALTPPVTLPRWERLANAHHLGPRQRYLLRALWEWREATAHRLNRPPFRILANALLVALAQTPPRGLYDLSAVGLSPQQIRLWGDEILQVVLKAQSQKTKVSLAPTPLDPSLMARVERLRAWRKRVAQQWSVESDIILPRTLLEELAQLAPQTLEELQKVLHRSPWRFRTFGRELLQVLQGENVTVTNHVEVEQ